jgi:arylsulfatase A-like enzyme
MSIEVEDTYLRLDRDLAELLTLLETQFKKEEILIFLTADHGAVNVPQYLIDNRIPAGYFDMKAAANDLKEKCKNQFGVDSLVRNISNSHVFLDYERISANKLNQTKIENAIASWLLEYDGVAQTLTRNSLENTKFNEGIASIIQRGFNQNRSGDVLFTLESGWIMAGYSTGTTHGSPYQYDTHVPLLWYGAGIAKGETKSKIVIPDIAATLAVMLNIQAPSACTGVPIKELVK